MMTRAALLPLAALLPAMFTTTANAQAQPDAGWQACAATADGSERLACFDRWAQRQQPQRTEVAVPATATPATPPSLPAERRIAMTSSQGCHDRASSELSRFWELEAASDCGTFGIRGYRAINMSTIAANNVNNTPTSGNPANVVTTPLGYGTSETRLQLSIRTKLAQGLLTRANPAILDSLWFGYTQQSYWQIFSGGISRPFRTTDHEPELVYVYPSDYALPAGWRLRYTGVGLTHQSNGQALPLSRSWNRVYLMAGAELDRRVQVQARIWKRIPEQAADDDNPGISDSIGRGELTASWNMDHRNIFSATLRSSLSHSARGSVRLEWLRAVTDDAQGAPAGLRLHTQLFSGYGDSLLDYNHRRTVLSVGLSLVDW